MNTNDGERAATCHTMSQLQHQQPPALQDLLLALFPEAGRVGVRVLGPQFLSPDIDHRSQVEPSEIQTNPCNGPPLFRVCGLRHCHLHFARRVQQILCRLLQQDSKPILVTQLGHKEALNVDPDLGLVLKLHPCSSNLEVSLNSFPHRRGSESVVRCWASQCGTAIGTRCLLPNQTPPQAPWLKATESLLVHWSALPLPDCYRPSKPRRSMSPVFSGLATCTSSRARMRLRRSTN